MGQAFLKRAMSRSHRPPQKKARRSMPNNTKTAVIAQPAIAVRGMFISASPVHSLVPRGRMRGRLTDRVGEIFIAELHISFTVKPGHDDCGSGETAVSRPSRHSPGSAGRDAS